MRSRNEVDTTLFEDRKKEDKISYEDYNNLFERAKVDSDDKNKSKKDSKSSNKDNDIESNDALNQDYNQLNIITISHSVLFILFLSLLIGLSLNTLLSFVFPIYTESSFNDQIPSDLNIHGFNIGPAYFDGVVREANQTNFVNIEIPPGLTVDLETGYNEFYVSAEGTILFTYSEEYRNESSFVNMETELVKSDPLILDDYVFKFGTAGSLIINDSFEVMGKINCTSLIYNKHFFDANGRCSEEPNTLTETHSKSIKSFLQNLQLADNFGFVNNFVINYPYIAVTDNNEMRIYKYDNDAQFLIGSVKGKGNLFKGLNSNSFIFGQDLYRIDDTKIEKIDKFNYIIDYENETIDNDGNKLISFYNKTGIYFIQCNGANCNKQKSLFLYNLTSNKKNSTIMKPFDLKISFDQFGSPVITSNLLRAAFLIDQENNSFEIIYLDFDEDNNIEDIRMLTYSDQLLYLSNHTLGRYLI